MVTLQFQRSPFHPIKRTVMVPWNEIIVIQTPIVMSAGAEEVIRRSPWPDAPQHDMFVTVADPSSASGSRWVLNRTVCAAHDYQITRPRLYMPHASKNLPASNGAARNANVQSSHETIASIGGSGQVLQETLSIPGSPIKLVYQSSGSPGFLSTIDLQLTDDHIPTQLKLVHLRIVVEGNLFAKVFEAEPSIKYTYAWNKRNVYRQKVYGLATARGEYGTHAIVT